MSGKHAIHVVIFLGGPCDGEEQNGASPPPTPEFLHPWGAGRDAVYTLESEKNGVYRFRFAGFRARPKKSVSARKPKSKE